MKKDIALVIASAVFLTLAAGPGFGWQGRMAGMDYPTGLVEDESDFLIHPAGIASGKGTNYYGGYTFTYDRTPECDFHTSIVGDPVPLKFDADGHELRHEGQAGLAFPLGKNISTAIK